MAKKDLSRYLWDGLNLERYEVIRIIPQNRDHAVIVMRCRDKGNHHWCLEYLGNGHYFDTAQQLMDYYESRKFRKPFWSSAVTPGGGHICTAIIADNGSGVACKFTAKTKVKKQEIKL